MVPPNAGVVQHGSEVVNGWWFKYRVSRVFGPVEWPVGVWHRFAMDDVAVGHELIAVVDTVIDALIELEVKLVVWCGKCWP